MEVVEVDESTEVELRCVASVELCVALDDVAPVPCEFVEHPSRANAPTTATAATVLAECPSASKTRRAFPWIMTMNLSELTGPALRFSEAFESVPGARRA